jgi:hypothetical protein
VGGATGTILGFAFNPKAIPQDFEHMEPSILYQCHLAMLANYCAYLAREHRKPAPAGETKPPEKK